MTDSPPLTAAEIAEREDALHKQYRMALSYDQEMQNWLDQFRREAIMQREDVLRKTKGASK